MRKIGQMYNSYSEVFYKVMYVLQRKYLRDKNAKNYQHLMETEILFIKRLFLPRKNRKTIVTLF